MSNKVFIGNIMGPPGPAGPAGPAGPTGPIGQTGPTGTLSGTMTTYVAPKVVPLADSAILAVDASEGNVFTCTIAGNRMLANPTNVIPGQHLSFVITEDAVGGRTLSFDTNYDWGQAGSAPSIDSAANAVTILSFIAISESKLRFAGAN